MLRAMFFWVVLCSSVADSACAVQVIAPPTQFVRIYPGQRGQLPLTLQLSGPFDNHRLSFNTFPLAPYADYAFSTQNVLCGQPRWELLPDGLSAALIIELPPGEVLRRECVYDVQRSANSNRDLRLGLNTSATQAAYFGYVPNPELSHRLVSVGADGSKVFQVQVQNVNEFRLNDVPIRSGCLEYDGGAFSSTNHVFAFDFPGACTYVDRAFCLNFGGQSSTGYRFTLATVAANSSASCLIKLVPRRPEGVALSRIAIGYGLDSASLIPLGADGGQVYVKDTELIPLSFTETLAQVPSLGFWSTLLLLGLILGSARGRVAS